MQNRNKTFKTLLVASFLLGLFGLRQNLLQAAVFDGGEYSRDKVSSHTDFGTDGPEPQPSNFAFEQDRFSSAPVGKPLYVLGEDHKCHWGNFAYNKFEKALIVYYKTPLSSDRCIYQKQLDSKPSGYSISAKNGGVCVPTLGVGEATAANTWKLEETGNPVSFALCVEQTASYGDYFKKASSDRQVADIGSTTQTATASAKVVANDNAKTETFNLGPSVQESNVPWKSGAVYRSGFPSLSHETQNWHGDSQEASNDVNAAPTAKHPQFATLHEEAAVPAPAVSANPITASAMIPDGIVTRSNGGGYTVQISSSTSKDEAQKQVDKLKVRGVEDAWVMQAEVRGVTYYRVCNGHYASARAAKLAQPKVAIKSGVKEAFIQKVVDRTPASASSQNN